MTLKKVFGIISYFPDCDTDYHTQTRNTRIPRFYSLLKTLDKLWSDVDIIIIAQNWKDDVKLPVIHNKITRYDYPKLGILNARRTLREKFLESDYDYLIMLDDDGIISAKDPTLYMNEIDDHPGGVGVIRHHNCPLMLLAISKELYSQIDMPDIDAENGDGFEDDVFVASCFAKFPDKAFDFTQDIVKDISFKYDGPDKIPSTWAREAKFDWHKMVHNTAQYIIDIENKGRWMDFVVPYVNCADKNWQQSYMQHTGSGNTNSVRFRSWGTLRYLFRGVEKYMPFVRQIVLIVSDPSQVPVWVNKETVRIVYHRDFIPTEFLPTFNSCTIESFLYNIEGLSDKFIYANDDLFPFELCTEDMFFFGDKPCITFVEHEKYTAKMMFRCQCRAGMELIQKALGLPTDYPEWEIVRPYHITTPMNTKILQTVKDLCEEEIKKTITNVRNGYNVNQYIYPYYHYFTGYYQRGGVECKYYEINDKTFNQIREEIVHGHHHWLCLNDSSHIQNYGQTRALLLNAFKRRFPNRCRYEI